MALLPWNHCLLQIALYLNETGGTASAQDAQCIFIGLDDYISAVVGAPVQPSLVIAYIQQGVRALYNAGARM